MEPLMSLCGNSLLCSEFPLLLIFHIILVGFLHPTIQIKVTSQEIFISLAWTYL